MKIKTENRLVLCVRKRDNFDEESQEQQKPAYIEPKEKISNETTMEWKKQIHTCTKQHRISEYHSLNRHSLFSLKGKI